MTEKKAGQFRSTKELDDARHRAKLGPDKMACPTLKERHDGGTIPSTEFGGAAEKCPSAHIEETLDSQSAHEVGQHSASVRSLGDFTEEKPRGNTGPKEWKQQATKLGPKPRGHGKKSPSNGACDHVINPGGSPSRPVKERAASRTGEQYASTTGDPKPKMVRFMHWYSLARSR